MNKEGLTRWRKQRKASAQLASPPPLHPADWWEWATKLKKVEPSAVRGSSFQVAKCVPSVLCLQISLPPAVVSSKKVDLLYYFLSAFGKKCCKSCVWKVWNFLLGFIHDALYAFTAYSSINDISAVNVPHLLKSGLCTSTESLAQ